MQIVYSAFYEVSAVRDTGTLNITDTTELKLRLMAHDEVCGKYSEEIKAIQHYLPQWQPVFRLT